jgi:hypothetical protein
MRVEEVASEKLARYRRTSLTRDLYDLAWIAQRVLDEPLVRRLTVMKIWHDVIDDGLGERPFQPAEILDPRSAADFNPEAIGYLTTPVDVPGWISTVERRYRFLDELDDEEREWARCNPGDRWAVEQAVADAIQETGAASPKDMGRVMKAVMTRLAGQTIDGKAVNELVRRKLAGP